MRGGAPYAALAIIVCLALALAVILGTITKPEALSSVRALGEFVLYNTFNVFNKRWWAGSPEAVTAILWDYRGLDTVFETIVLYAAVAGCVVLGYTSLLGRPEGTGSRREGLTVVVKAASKILFALILITSINVALHGYVTPGGGFAGGSTFAIAPLLIIAAYSTKKIVSMGFKFLNSSVIRSLGLVLLAVVVLSPLIYYGFTLQNQPKPGSGFPGYPAFLGPLFLGGSLLYLNVAEFLVVGMEFVLVFLAIHFIDKLSERGGNRC